MPIPWRRKFGITFTYHVPFLQQAGIYSASDILHIDHAVKLIRSFCSYGYYYFNFAQNEIQGQQLTNMILPLDRTVTELFESFTGDAKRNIRRASKLNLIYKEAVIDEAIILFRQLYGSVLKISPDQYQSFGALCKSLELKGAVLVRKVQDADGKTLSIVLLLNFQNRLYNIMNATLPAGKKLSANYLLLYSVFQEFQSSGHLFDFEGSDHPGIRRFYIQFTRLNQPYYRYHFNDLRFPARLFK